MACRSQKLRTLIRYMPQKMRRSPALFKHSLTISYGTANAIWIFMNPIQTYRDLETWQFGMKLVEHCYKETKRFPLDERYGLTAQLRRAAVSIPANVAEGACRHT